MNNCIVCQKLVEGRNTKEWEVEQCEDCGHFFVPYVDNCACGYHYHQVEINVIHANDMRVCSECGFDNMSNQREDNRCASCLTPLE